MIFNVAHPVNYYTTVFCHVLVFFLQLQCKKFNAYNITDHLTFVVLSDPWSEKHTCDKFQKGIREIFVSFQGGLSKMYRIYYRNILNSDKGGFEILVKSVMF